MHHIDLHLVEVAINTVHGSDLNGPSPAPLIDRAGAERIMGAHLQRLTDAREGDTTHEPLADEATNLLFDLILRDVFPHGAIDIAMEVVHHFLFENGRSFAYAEVDHHDLGFRIGRGLATRDEVRNWIQLRMSDADTIRALFAECYFADEVDEEPRSDTLAALRSADPMLRYPGSG